jgi:hypothetical protein
MHNGLAGSMLRSCLLASTKPKIAWWSSAEPLHVYTKYEKRLRFIIKRAATHLRQSFSIIIWAMNTGTSILILRTI